MEKVDTFSIIVTKQKLLLDLGAHKCIGRYELLEEITITSCPLDGGLCMYPNLWIIENSHFQILENRN